MHGVATRTSQFTTARLDKVKHFGQRLDKEVKNCHMNEISA
jgi:hypothetical protein